MAEIIEITRFASVQFDFLRDADGAKLDFTRGKKQAVLELVRLD